MEKEKPSSAANLQPDPVLTLRGALQAFTAVNQDTVLLEYGNVVMRKDYDKLDKVRLFSGGVAGIDLSQVMFVGRGMLTGAILGEFVAPSSREILRTLKELTQGENGGIFVIAQPNPDLFNFGLAVERANADCRSRVKLLIINDDRSECKERYSSGYILLTKIVGAMAERGMTYDEIYKCYQDTYEHIITVPLNYAATDQGSKENRLVTLENFDTQVEDVISKRSQSSLHLHPSIPIVVLINMSKNLDTLSELGLVKLVIEKLTQMGVCLVRVYFGNFITLNPGSPSLTVMKVMDKNVTQYLDDQCSVPGWTNFTQILPEVTLKNEIPGFMVLRGRQQIPLKGVRLSEGESLILTKAVQFACDALASCERQLNIIDAETSSGNVGTRLKNMAQKVTDRLKNNTLPVNCPFAFFKKLGIIAETSISGSMGSIYGVFFEKGAEVFGDLPEVDYIIPASIWAKAFSSGSQAIRELCADPEKIATTMCYPMKCCEIAINDAIESDQGYVHSYGVGITAAEHGAQRTKYEPHKHPDAGAHAVGIWLRAVFEAVKLMSSDQI